MFDPGFLPIATMVWISELYNKSPVQKSLGVFSISSNNFMDEKYSLIIFS